MKDGLQIFRDTNGDPKSTGELRLRLRDFVPEDVPGPVELLQQEIIITAERLCEFLAEAEKQMSIVNQRTKKVTTTRAWTQKRRRERTPTGELEERDEKRFQMIEEKEQVVVSRDDTSYKTGTPSEVGSSKE